MNEQPTDLGLNRTGMGASPREAPRMRENERELPFLAGDQIALAARREQFIRDAEPIGHVAPPTKLKGVFESVKEALKGHAPAVLFDKLGARLGYERAGVRLYDAVLAKFEAGRNWPGGPSRAALEDNRREELAHFQLLTRTIRDLGGDPTTVTPGADVEAVTAAGVFKAVTDPRTTLAQTLMALLVAERADVDGWSGLITVVDASGLDAAPFRQAAREEDDHVAKVKGWVEAATRHEIGH